MKWHSKYISVGSGFLVEMWGQDIEPDRINGRDIPMHVFLPDLWESLAVPADLVTTGQILSCVMTTSWRFRCAARLLTMSASAEARLPMFSRSRLVVGSSRAMMPQLDEPVWWWDLALPQIHPPLTEIYTSLKPNNMKMQLMLIQDEMFGRYWISSLLVPCWICPVSQINRWRTVLLDEADWGTIQPQW